MGGEFDCTTPAGKRQLHILAALAEFERDGRKGMKAGLFGPGQDARGEAGTIAKDPAGIAVLGGTVRAAAKAWGVSKTTAAKWIANGGPPLT